MSQYEEEDDFDFEERFRQLNEQLNNQFTQEQELSQIIIGKLKSIVS